MSSSTKESSGSAGRIAAAVAVVAMLGLLVAWFAGWFGAATDPRILAIQKLQQEAEQKFVAGGGPHTLDEAKEAVAAMGRIRDEIRSLPESLQPQAEAAGGNLFRSAMRKRIDAYFDTPPEKRTAELDRQIKQEQLMVQAFMAGGGPGGVAGGPQPGVAGGTRPGGDAARGGGPPPTGGGRSRTEEGRNNWRKNMIDRTSPQMRARYTEYRAAMEKRKQELGLPTGGFGPR